MTVRIANHGPLRVTGVAARHKSPVSVPGQWEKFAPQVDRIPGKIGHVMLGVGLNITSSGFDYLAGVEVAVGAETAPGMQSIRLPHQRYAVFTHQGPIASIKQTMAKIDAQWASAVGQRRGDYPACIEHYGENFRPDEQDVSIEIWIPLAGD